MPGHRHRHLLIGLLAVVALVSGVHAQELGETIIKRGPAVEGDLYLAGRTIEIMAEIKGDLVAAGQYVSIGRPVAQDVVVAAETVRLNGVVGDDVRVLGRQISLDAPIGDHVVAAGELVTLSGDASVGARAWLAGRLIQILGAIGSDLRAAGQEVVIGGTVQGDVKIYAERIRVLETARILGSFEYASEHEPEIADGAVIRGDITRMARPALQGDTTSVVGAAVGGAIVFTLGLLVVGVAYLLVLPRVAGVAVQAAVDRPWTAAALGLAVLVGVPFVIIVLTITAIGLPLALATAALYAVALLLGYVNGIAWLADLMLRKWGKAAVYGRLARLSAFALMLVTMMILQLVPLVGQLAGLAIWLIGLGSLVLALSRLYRSAPLSTPS